jgi:hypothetical protein
VDRLTPSAIVRFVLLSLLCLALAGLHGCALVTAPLATAAFGGAGLALKGAELQKDIKKADSHEALDIPFEQAWDLCFTALLALDIEIVKSTRMPSQNGGVIEARIRKTKIKVVVAEINDRITEVGIWVKKDKALAEFLSHKINEICCSMRPVERLPGTLGPPERKEPPGSRAG